MENINGSMYFSDQNISDMKKILSRLKEKFGASTVELRKPVQVRFSSDYKIFIKGCTKYPRSTDVDYEIDLLKDIFNSTEISMAKNPFEETTTMISIYNVQYAANYIDI